MPKSMAMQGARFETVDLSKQPNPQPAIDLISKYPIVEVHEHIVACDGGGGSLGHPKIYINLVQFSFLLLLLLTPLLGSETAYKLHILWYTLSTEIKFILKNN